MAYISSITDINGHNYSLKAVKSAAILTGEILPGVDDDDNEDLGAYVEDLTELYHGVFIYLLNDFATSSNGFTLNVNDLGAKPVYYSNYLNRPAGATFYAGTSMLFMYNSQRVSGGCWDMIYDSPSRINQFDGGQLIQFDTNGHQRTYLCDAGLYLQDSTAATRIHLSSSNGNIESKDASLVTRTKMGNDGFYVYNSSGTLTDYMTPGNVKSNNIYPLDQTTHKIADFVYEQGTSSSWTYRKWHSGKAECWKTFTYTKTTSNWSNWASSGTYLSTVAGPYDYPFTFTALPLELAAFMPNSSVDNNVWGGALICTKIGTTSKTGGYQSWRPNKPAATAYYRLYIYAIGTI